MSKQNNDAPVTAVPDAEPQETVEKSSFIPKVKAFAKKHQKPLIAAGLLGILVGAAAATGPKNDNSTDLDFTEETPEPAVLPAPDTELAQDN